MKVKVIAKLNKRLWPSTKNTPLPNPHLPGDIIEVESEVEGEAPLNATNTRWYKAKGGYYVWSGGVLREDIRATLGYNPEALDWWHHEFQIPAVWQKLGMGKRALVTIIDSGIDRGHPYFNSQNISTDLLDASWGSVDNWGHGTQVASMIIANGQRLVGIAPEVSVHMIKMFDREGTSVPDLIRAVAKVPSHTDVLCISLAMLKGAHDAALEQELKKLKTPLVICAAGNSSDQTKDDDNVPAIFDSTISVGATQQGGLISPNSSRSSKINLVAPGHNVKCLIPNRIDYFGPDSGTSFSAPFVAGLTAIAIGYLRRKGMPVNYGKIMQLLLQSTDIKNDPGLYGRGVVNPSKFVTKILSL